MVSIYFTDICIYLFTYIKIAHSYRKSTDRTRNCLKAGNKKNLHCLLDLCCFILKEH